MRSALYASLMALALWGAATPASATELTYSFSGTVVSGYDGQDLFTGGDLTGMSYTVVETFENATLQPVVTPGLATYVNSNNFVDIDITIGAETSGGGGYNLGSVALQSGRLNIAIDQGSTYMLDFTALSPGIGTSTTSFNADSSNSTIAGSFTFGPFGPKGTPDDGVTSIVFGNSTGLSAVPLPAGLPMFGAALLGLGTVGFGLKRTRKAALAA